MDKKIKRIVLTGPESTGKSTLAQQLAEHYQTVWVPEYARLFIDELKRPYQEDDLLEIAQRQIEVEEYLSQFANEYLFCDTSLIVIKVWSEVKYGRCHPWILEQLELRQYDSYLLCDIDVPWIADDQREHPELRKELFDRYERELSFFQKKYLKVSGNNSERLSIVLPFFENL